MQVVEFVTANLRAVAIGSCAIIGLLAVAWPRRRVRRKRLSCDLTPLEVRAFDAVDALDELNAEIEQSTIPLPEKILTSWIKAKTASNFLRRYLENGR